MDKDINNPKESNFEINSSIEKEYFHLQKIVDDFDAKSLTIKAWSVSLSVTIAGSSALISKPQLLLFAAITSLMFWLIDTSWKVFQYANYRRINEIEEYIKERKDNIDALQIGTSWFNSYNKGGYRRFLKIMCWHHVFLPHGAMMILFLCSYLIMK